MLCPDEIVVTGMIFLFSGGVLALFLWLLCRRGYERMGLLKRKNHTEKASKPHAMESNVQALSENNERPALLSVDDLERMTSTITRKDTFISSEAALTGNVNGQGNIVIEGRVEGDINSAHQVRIERTGQVSGDIHAQHIMVNGRVVGRLFAEVITLQPDGRIEGDLVTDALIIEKGGVFVGQSQLKTDGQPAADKRVSTPLKVSTESSTLSTESQ